MKTEVLIDALRSLKVETGSLACSGCGHEHNCSTRGCAIMREAADLIEKLLAECEAMEVDIRKGYDCCEICERTKQEFTCESECDQCDLPCLCKSCDKTFSNFVWRGIMPGINAPQPDENISRETYNLRICFELKVNTDPEVGGFPVGLQLTIPNAKEDLPYEKLTQGLNLAAVLHEFGLDKIARPEDLRIITPEEFDERYGDDEEEEDGCDEDEG